MSKSYPTISDDLKTWMESQPLFFVATAPLSPDGLLNCSPKGGDAFRVLGPTEAAYLDYTGSGAETAAHLRENGRLVFMFCAFSGGPRIARLHGRGTVLQPGHPRFDSLVNQFSDNPGTRSIIHMDVQRVGTSCGYSVPEFDYKGPRDTLDRWARNKGPEGLVDYVVEKNLNSIEGLPAYDSPLPREPS